MASCEVTAGRPWIRFKWPITGSVSLALDLEGADAGGYV